MSKTRIPPKPKPVFDGSLTRNDLDGDEIGSGISLHAERQHTFKPPTLHDRNIRGFVRRTIDISDMHRHVILREFLNSPRPLRNYTSGETDSLQFTCDKYGRAVARVLSIWILTQKETNTKTLKKKSEAIAEVLFRHQWRMIRGVAYSRGGESYNPTDVPHFKAEIREIFGPEVLRQFNAWAKKQRRGLTDKEKLRKVFELADELRWNGTTAVALTPTNSP